MLHQPLDEFLGARGNVGVLRILSRHGGALSASEVANRSRLTRQGANKALAQLVTLGIVTVEGQGRSRLYRLNRRHPLAVAVIELFQAESRRVDAFFDLVRHTAEAMRPPPIAVWMFGSAARREDRADSDLDLAVVGPPEHVLEQAESLEDALLEMAESSAIQPSIITLTPDEVRRHAAGRTGFWQSTERDFFPIFGPMPSGVVHG
jgi:predicted nucleotidyltransferase